MLLTAKILTTFFTVILLTSVARRFGPSVAGILAGFPLGSAITLYFIGVEQGTEFAALASLHTLSGLLGCLVLAATYWWSSKQFSTNKSPWRSVCISIVISLSAFGLFAALLQWLPSHRGLNLFLIIAGIVITQRLFKHIVNSPIIEQPHNFWQRPWVALIFRAVAATISVISITALAHYLNPSQAGVAAAFPVSFLPTLVVLHLSYGPGVVASTVRQYPAGLGAMVVYVLAVSYCYQPLGIQLGTLVSLSASVGYLLVYWLIKRKLDAKKAQSQSC
ncbi:MAG: hypothetical protein P1U57_13640 [Oleibacter sp.]|nr:hypothetical protein [Thalassolituus sp.]